MTVPWSARQTAPVPDDDLLVARIRSGDAQAFEMVFQQYARELLNYAYGHLGSKDEAEDVVQMVFARVWMAHERWEVRGTLGAYLTLATRNEIRDRAKHDRVVARRHSAITRGATHGERPLVPGCDDELEAAETAATIQVALGTFAPQRRMACTLRWAHGLSYAEIAVRMHVAPRTVERHLALAYKELRRRLPDLPALG
jgi:RNA polymerase sigma factor (sigma-70 family)